MRTTPIALTCAALACVPAAAQEAPAVAELPPVQVTAGRHAEGLFDVPQQVTVVSRDEIERSTRRTATELLRGETGVYLQSSGPGQGVVIVRGLKGSEVLHLVDGMRLNNAFFRNSPSQYISLVDAYNIDRVEVLRGPASTLYGSDAMGGVVQFLTPEHRFAGERWSAESGALAQYGSADASGTGRAWLAAGREDLSVAGGVTYVSAGGVKPGDASRIDEALTGYRARGYDAKLLATPREHHELMLAAQFYEYPDLPRYFEISVQPNNDPPGVPQRTEARFHPNDRSFWHARYRMGSALGFAEDVEVHLARQVINDDRSVIPQPPDQPAGRRERESNRSTLDGLTLQAVSRAGPVKLIYGADAYRDTVDSIKSCEPLAGGCPATTVPVFPDGARQRSAGIYLNTEWHWFGRLLVDAGLRYSQVGTTLPETALSPAARIDHDAVTGTVGTRLSLTPRLNWTVNAGRGFRAPNIFDLGTLGPRGGSNQVNVPNPALRPETIDSIDTGFKWHGGGFRGEWVAFYMRYADRIEAREPTGRTVADGQYGCTSAGGCPEVHSANISEAVYWGWEAGAAWDVADALSLTANLNLVRGVEDRAGAPRTPANRIPPVNGRLGLLWQPGPYSAEAFALFADEQRRLDADDRADIRIAPGGTPGWGTLNARFGWTPSRAVRLQFEAANLLDRRYREHGSGIEGHGRSATLTAELRW